MAKGQKRSNREKKKPKADKKKIAPATVVADASNQGRRPAIRFGKKGA